MVGLIGSGNMARALARGWGEPVLCADPVRERAEALAAETGGEALAGNGEVADRADVVVLCHKPAQLAEVAEQLGGRADTVVSILASTPVADVQAAYPDASVFRMLPSVPVQIRQGVTAYAPAPRRDPEREREIVALFERLGPVVTVEDRLIDTAMALMSCAPAYVALLVEAQVDAGVKRGLSPEQAGEMVVETFAGTAALLRERGMDTLAVRREVTSPGGATARGLAALERGGVRAAFLDAIDAVLA